jgi:hypothetical protein
MKKILLSGLFCAVGVAVSAQELWQAPAGQQSRVSSFENRNGVKGGGGQSNRGGKGHAFDRLAVG